MPNPKKENNIPGPPVGYTDLIDEFTRDKIEENSKKERSFPLRPSAAGYCGRRLAFDLMEYKGYASYEKTPMEPNTYRLLNLGHSVEYSAIKNFELVNFWKIKYKQQSVDLFKLEPIKGEEDKIIEGSADLVVYSPEWKCVIDIKSQKDAFSKAFPTRWKETLKKYEEMSSLQALSETAFYAENLEAFVEELKDDFLVDNLLQLNMYACSQFFQDRGIDHAVIYKYNKNDSRHYEIRFKPCKKLFKRIQDKFNQVNKAVANKDPKSVPCDFKLGSMRCAFCPYAKECWPEGQDGLKAWFSTFPKKKWPTDLHKIKDKGQLKKLFQDFEKGIDDIKIKEETEQEIVKLMLEKGLKKIKLDNEHIYEVKYLKSPRPHYELRRTKL